MFCTKCGRQSTDNEKFCSVCGSPLEANQQATQQASPQATTTTPQSTPSPSGESLKTKTTASLLGFFLGAWGIMDFYAGNTKRGVIKLILTFTVVGSIATLILNILDMFKVANGKYLDENGLPLSGPNNVAKVLAIVMVVLQAIAVLSTLAFIIIFGIIPVLTASSANSFLEESNRSRSYEASSQSDYSFTDRRDGQTYRTIRVGGMVWMAENLNYDNGNSYCYGNNSYNCDTYGRLYNWYAAQSVCPSGWRLPSKYDWDMFDKALREMGYSTRAQKAEALRSTEWYGTNGIGFNATASGTRFKGGYYGAPGTTTESAHYWSSTELDYEKAYDWFVYLNKAGTYGQNDKQERGYSVRCVRN